MSEFDEGARWRSALALEPGQLGERQFLEYLGGVAALVRGNHLPEAEQEVLRALQLRPTDLRGLKLLALVRFKRGRYAEAREVYEVLARTTPDDASVRMSLGLIALKMDWGEEAVAELEVAARLGENSPNLWSHLGYAYERLGRTDMAAQAFRRAGQEDAANAGERAPLPSAGGVGHDLAAGGGSDRAPLRIPDSKRPIAPSSLIQPSESGFFPPQQPPETASGNVVVTSELQVEGFSRVDDPAAEDNASTSLTSFVLGRLLDVPLTTDEFTSPFASLVGEVLRFSIAGETHLRSSALLAACGALDLAPARRRVRGRITPELLVDSQGDFVLCKGSGEVWLAPASTPTRLLALTLEDDILFIRQSRVVAFDQDVAWEAGRLPGDDLALLQLRGTGRVVLDVGEERFRTFKVSGDRPLWVERGRLLGWVGRMVPRAVKGSGTRGGNALIACEGEGVLLVSVHGLIDQPTDERPQPGDDGPSVADTGSAPVHR